MILIVFTFQQNEKCIMIVKVNWDSDFFNLKVGSVYTDFDDLLIEEIIKFDVVYVFSGNPNLSYPLQDKKVVLKINDLQNVDVSGFMTGEFDFFDSSKDSYKEILKLGLQSGEFSRFRLDKNFTEKQYENLYTEWINKSLSKDLATHILVERKDEKIVGFATLGKKNAILADIGLVAVSNEYRGLGIGKKIINKAIALAQLLNYTEIQVVTQLDNFPAMNLYKHCGFTENKITYIYHIWTFNNDTIQ